MGSRESNPGKLGDICPYWGMDRSCLVQSRLTSCHSWEETLASGITVGVIRLQVVNLRLLVTVVKKAGLMDNCQWIRVESAVRRLGCRVIKCRHHGIMMTSDQRGRHVEQQSQKPIKGGRRFRFKEGKKLI